MSTASTSRDLVRQGLTGLRLLVVMTLLLGVAYPAVVWAVSRIGLADRAEGQLVRDGGDVVGSTIVGQSFTVEDAPALFHSRPSANDYDTLATAPSNLGPSNPDLVASIRERRTAIADLEGVDPARVPADAVTASASGVDPDISPAYAAIQVERVAREQGLSATRVRELVADHTDGRILGFLGEPHVNVLELNRAVLRAAG